MRIQVDSTWRYPSLQAESEIRELRCRENVSQIAAEMLLGIVTSSKRAQMRKLHSIEPSIPHLCGFERIPDIEYVVMR